MFDFVRRPWRRGDAGTWGREDFGTRRRAGIRGRDKRHIGKEEPWTLEIISYWSYNLSSILDYFTFDPQKKVFYQFSAKVRCYLFITSQNPRASPSSEALASPRPRVPASPRPRVPASLRPHVLTSPRPTSHVPVPLSVTALTNSIWGTKY